MGSVGNQNPWQTYDTYKDCSQGICSIYCPQWCYIIFPPPPPFSLPDGGGDGGSGTDFSPLIIAVIGILASAFILVSYYTIISKYCRRRSSGENTPGWTNESNWQGGAPSSGGGLDESIIKSITVWKYKKSFDGSGNDCSVCLSEFQENESLRLLPKCNHSFHLSCIDTWLKSNASCPLCRANIASANVLQPPQPQPPPPENQETPPAANTVYAQEYQYRSNESVIVVEDLEQSVINNVIIDEIREEINGGDEIQEMRRSASLNSLLIIKEDDEMREMGIKKNGRLNMIRSPLALKRSISTGRFMFMTRYDNGGRTSNLIPN